MYNYHITKTTQFHIINIRIGDVIDRITHTLYTCYNK
jgi:hypothetical protein